MTHPTASTYLRTVEFLAGAALLAYPAAMIALRGGMNGVFLLLLLVSICVIVVRPAGMPAMSRDREMASYVVAMATLPVAIFLSQSYHAAYDAHPYDAASRFLLAVPVFIVLRRIKLDVLTIIQYAFPVGAIAGLVASDFSGARMRTDFLDPIHFGDFSLMLGVMSLLCMNWTGRDSLVLRTLKMGGFVAGACATLLSGTLGALVAVPLLAAIVAHFRVVRVTRRQASLALFAAVIAAGLAYMSSRKVQELVQAPLSRGVAIMHGNFDTDEGIRLQLYKASILIFARNPAFGVGPEGFKEQMTSMQQSGVLSAKAAEAGRSEVHNEILSKTVGLGVPGLLSILLIYFVPFVIFWRKAKSAAGPARLAGIMGVTFVSGFFVFGLSLDVLNLTMAAAFYSFTVAVLLAACLNESSLASSSTSSKAPTSP